MNELARTMAYNDTMQVNEQEEIGPHEARERYRPTVPVIKQECVQFVIDGDYIVSNLEMDGDGCLVLIGGKKRKVSLEYLIADDRKLFFSKSTQYERGKPLTPITIRMNVMLKGGAYDSGYILSLNAPRDEAMTYAEAVQKSIDVVEAMDEED